MDSCKRLFAGHTDYMVRDVLGRISRTTKYSDSNSKIVVKCGVKSPHIFITPSDKDTNNENVVLHIDLHNCLSTTERLFQITDNDNNVKDDILITEKMTKEQFDDAIRILTKDRPENRKIAEILNESVISMLKTQVEKSYFPLDIRNDKIILGKANGIKYIVDLKNKNLTKTRQSFIKAKDKITKIIERNDVSNLDDFRFVSKILQEENKNLDKPTLDKFLRVKYAIKLKVIYNSLLKKSGISKLLHK